MRQQTAAAENATEGAALHGVRRVGSVRCDGHIDEEAWKAAAVYTDFVQSSPRPGQVPSQHTEVRILYDNESIFVGITAFDDEPHLIAANLGRRDAPPVSDLVTVALDTRRDFRNAYVFTVNAGGVQRDGMYVDDGRLVEDWDAVWCGESARTNLGWTAEFEIPLNALRFSGNEDQLWGIGVRREIPRTHEILDTTLIPSNSGVMVSRFRELRGLRSIRASNALSLAPYLGFRLMTMREVPNNQLMTALDLGLDINLSIGSSLRVAASLNPDYGQVEADELVLNLSSYEQFFPEKRPFFVDGLELFEPIDENTPQLFYSRRVGLDAPIVAATKIVASAGLFQIGVLDAVVTGPHRPLNDRDLTRLQYHVERPLHLGPNAELPREPVVTKNILATTVRAAISESVSVGAQAVSSNALSKPCAASTLPEGVEVSAAECLAPRDGSALALNVDARRGDWVGIGQVHGSRVDGGPVQGIVLRDGTELKAGDLGAGALVRLAKHSGEPWRLDLSYRLATPKLDLSQTGFLRAQNEQIASARVGIVRSDLGRLSRMSSELTGTQSWTSDGRDIPLGTAANWYNEVVWPNTAVLGAQLTGKFFRQDVREIAGARLAFDRPNYGQLALLLNSDASRSLLFSTFIFGGLNEAPRAPSNWFGGVEIQLLWRPSSRLEMSVMSSFNRETDGPRWLESTTSGDLIFGDLESDSASVTFRQLLVLTKDLTLQGYAQVFTASARYGPFYRLRKGDISGWDGRQSALARLPYEDPSYHLASVNLSLVLRWQYMPGSTIYAVCSRNQDQHPGAGLTKRSLGVGSLLSGPSDTVVLLKWSIFWNL